MSLTKSLGTNRLIRAVEETTGFKVSVDTIDGIDDDAQMISARPEIPMHMIRVSDKCLPCADYIVAAQCAMLLSLWSDPKRIPVFSPVPEKVGFLVDKVAGSPALRTLPAATGRGISNRVVTGLLHQLRSMPSEIRVVRDIYKDCPDLRQMQSESIESHLRKYSATLGPSIRGLFPEKTWRQNVSMIAAFALNWVELSDNQLAMLPYESSGFSSTARELLTEVTSKTNSTSQDYTDVVDAWARHLGLQTLYTWEYRNAHQ